MEGVDILAKLYALKYHVNELAPSDAAFVSEMVTLNQSRHMPNRHQYCKLWVWRFLANRRNQADVHTFRLVNAVSVALDQKIWRYMPLEQLFALLSTKALHFSPLSVMGDIAEGQLPGRAWEETKKQLPQGILEGLGSMDADAMMAIMVSQRRTDACIKYWYIDDSDSLKMWKEYAPKNGIAIQSVVRRLGASLQNSDAPVTIGPVTYFAPEDENDYVSEALYGSLYSAKRQ